MRRIETPEEKERKSKRNKLIIGILMLGLMIMSSAGYAFMSGDGFGRSTNNPQSGSEVNGRWQINVGSETLSFAHSPESVANIPLNVSINIEEYASSPVYVTMDEGIVVSEIANTLGKYVSLREACYGPCERDVPEKDCTSNLIVWNQSEENRVYQTDKCVFIEGDLRAVDAFLYEVLGAKN